MNDPILSDPCGPEQNTGRRCAVDGLVISRRDTWVLLGREHDDPVDLLLGEQGTMSDDPLRLCRAVLADGQLLIGEGNAHQDRLLSDLLRREDCGTT